jgi:hypothetical protein
VVRRERGEVDAGDTQDLDVLRGHLVVLPGPKTPVFKR